MTGRRVSDGDMPNLSRSAGQDTSGIPDAALAALLAAGTRPADPSSPVQHVADALTALRAAPAGDEAAGKAAALAQFRQRVGVSSPPIRSPRRRPTLLSSLLSAKAAAAAAVAVLGLGGVTTAAFANALPSAAQEFAHNTIGAPSPHASRSAHPGNNARHSGSPVGPNATGAAAFGLCTAYANATQHGTAAQQAVAFRNLENAAGGAANVASFCASVAHPGGSATPASGAPTSHPTGAPSSHPTGPPSPHPTGPPASNS